MSILSVNHAYGIWIPQSPEELLEESQVIVVGNITSVNKLELEQPFSSESSSLILDEYTITIEEFVKNPQDVDTLTVRQPTVSTPGRLVPHGGFEIGDRVLLYIEAFDGTNTYSKESFLIPKQCDTSSVIHEPRIIGSDYAMMQNGIEKKDNFIANTPIQFIAKSDTGTLSGDSPSIEYDAFISKQVGKIYKERVLHQTITAYAKPCEWLSVAEWEFTPDSGKYLLNGDVYKEKSRYSISNTFFSVLPEAPLKQVQSGTPLEKIQCGEGLILVTKYDGSPACVTPETIPKLIQRGWIDTDPRAEAYKNIPKFLCELYGGELFDGTGECMDLESSYKCEMLGGQWDGKCMIPNYTGKGIETEPDPNHVDNQTANNDDFVFSLYRLMAKDNNDSNFFFSPFSISTAFSMVYEGARGDTAIQIRDTFDFTQDDKTRWNNISETMKRLNHEKGFYALEVANGIWLSNIHETNPEYVDIVTTHYNGTAKSVDFVGNEGVDEINQWVKEKTRDKIPDILERGSTDDLTLLVLTNSIYFNGKWANQFNPNSTDEESFWTGNGNTVNAQMMKISDDMFNYAETGTIQILEMPYLGNDISMLVILPKDKNGLDSLEMSLDSDKINEFRNMMERQPLTVHIPKFGFESDYDLIPLLKELGVRDAFDKNAADFAGMTDMQVYLSQAKHKAFVDVHEKGTEAAAVTAVVATLTSGPPEPRHEFIANHPFVFVIQEKATGEILFVGHVIDPTS